MADQGIAYALITDGTAATVSQESSSNPSVGAITAHRFSAGTYNVSFPNSNIGTGWAALVTAYGNNTNFCSVSAWAGGNVAVTCYTAAGVLADSPFSIWAVASLNDQNIGYIVADQPTNPAYVPAQQSAGAGSDFIVRQGTGLYQVTSFENGPGNVQVTASTGGGRSCALIGPIPTEQVIVNVLCVNPAGAPSDSTFVLAIVPTGATPTAVAFTLADQLLAAGTYVPDPALSYNPTGNLVSVTHSSTGQYVATFAGLNAAQVNGGDARATAIDGSASSPVRCTVTHWAPGALGSLQVFVACNDVTGAPADAEFTVLVRPASGYAFATVSNAALVTAGLNPGGSPVTVAHSGTGFYLVNFPNSGVSFGWAVFANSSQASVYCKATFSGQVDAVNVLCFSLNGQPEDSAFTVLAVSDTNGRNIAFGLAENSAANPSDTLTTDAYNPAGTITSTRNAAGMYTVVFNGLSGSGGTVQVTAFGSDNTNCWSNGWSGINFAALVECTSPAGTPVDSDFFIAVIPAGATPNAIGYAMADQPSAASYFTAAGFTYNPGGPVKVTRSSAGQYTMTFPGLNAAGGAGLGHPQVTADLAANFCAATSVNNAGIDVMVQVTCSNLAQVPADATFEVLFFSPVVSPPATIAVSAGAPQSTLTTTPFNVDLAAEVEDANGSGVPNITVTFTAPASGPSGTFAGGSLTGTAITNASGIAMAPVFTANGTAGGPYVVTASSLVTTPANFLLTNDPGTSVTLQTSPPGLQVSIDGGALAAPAPLTVLLRTGSGHTIATQSPQAGTGSQFVWQNWSDGLAVSHAITVPAATVTYTATFKAQYQLSISASPAAGGAVTPATGVFYDAGTVVPISAMANSGYTFTGWSGNVANAGSASTTVAMSAAETVVANFAQMTSITFHTSPSGLQFSVDGGAALTAPQTLSLQQGPHTIAVATPQAGGAGTQSVFTGWSDAGAASHSINVSGSSATYTATFKTQYQLTTSASPAAGGTVTPPSGTFYDAATVVPITATANSGFTFNNWSGTVANANAASTTVTMSAPESLVANFSSLTGITIQTNPPGVQFTVDGQTAQTAPQTLNL